MGNQSYTATFLVDQTPEEAFAAVNNVRGWWSGEIEGGTDKLGDEFTYRYKDVHYSKQKLVELVPGKKVVWPAQGAHWSLFSEIEGGIMAETMPIQPVSSEPLAEIVCVCRKPIYYLHKVKRLKVTNKCVESISF